MQREFQSIPVGACAKCGRPAHSSDLLGLRCANPRADGPCIGTYRATASAADWILCAHCQGAGTFKGQHCAHCDSSGWIYARPEFP